MPKQKQPEITNEERKELLDAVSVMVHMDFADCDGSGSVFCPGCVAVRAAHALIEVYEDIEVDQIADNVIDKYKGGDPDVENVTTVH